jgi:hypothetical protein
MEQVPQQELQEQQVIHILEEVVVEVGALP